MGIGELNEKSLHAALKNWYAQPGDQLEVKVDGYFIDIVQETRGVRDTQDVYEAQTVQKNLLVEIQTRNFSAIKRKVMRLTKEHTLRLVYPIAQEKWIVKLPMNGMASPSRRKSPKRGKVTDVFQELVSFPKLMGHANFSLEVLLIWEEEIRRYDGRKGWRRRGWVTDERHLLEVVDRHLFETPADLWQLIPATLPDEFTTTDLVGTMGVTKRQAQQIAYCLRKMGMIELIGKHGRSNLYLSTP